MTRSTRPMGLKLAGITEQDPVTGDFIFRFPLEPESDSELDDDERFRWVVEEQLRVLLNLVELCEDGVALRVTGYRFLAEPEFRPLYPEEEQPP